MYGRGPAANAFLHMPPGPPATRRKEGRPPPRGMALRLAEADTIMPARSSPVPRRSLGTEKQDTRSIQLAFVVSIVRAVLVDVSKASRL